MRARLACTAASVLTISLLCADTASAQQTLNFSLGYFTVRGEDARTDGDVLVELRSCRPDCSLLFDISDFNSASLGAEWLIPIGDYIEAGAGVSFTNQTVPSIYEDLVQPDGSEIEQELKLRIIPIAATVRVLPLGRTNPFQPYVGGGIAIHNFRYSETGEFVDFTQPGLPLFRESYVATGNAIGPVAVFGARWASRTWAVGGELRYQKAEGELDETDFFGPKIDLGGLHFSATFGVRF